ncbi:MAG TPA: hypothetical protein VK463_06500 [Desulfomonilaceae bacterium]|nr:hypothetical protein [Desulfomonilaceae bacterium]
MEDQRILATAENFGTVSVCSGGVVHINLPHCSLKFIPADFSKFCELISQAKANFEPPRRAEGKSRLQLVTSELKTDPDPAQD